MKEYTRYGRFIRTNAEYLEGAYGVHNAVLIYVHTDTDKTPDIVGKWFATYHLTLMKTNRKYIEKELRHIAQIWSDTDIMVYCDDDAVTTMLLYDLLLHYNDREVLEKFVDDVFVSLLQNAVKTHTPLAQRGVFFC